MATTTTTSTGPLSAGQIASAAKAGGFPDNEIALAVAIALAESGGNARAHNANPPDDSYGLWQINMLGALGPARRVQFGIKSNDELYDPVTNARAAFMVRRGQGWNAWSVYANGRYKRYLADANQAVKDGFLPLPPFPFPGDPVGAGMEELAKLLAAPLKWLNEGIFRAAMFIGGGVLIVLALSFMVSMNQRKILGAAAGVIGPVKKAGKLVKTTQ